MKKQKYVLTRKLHAKEPMVPGDAIELTAEQAAAPMYRNRVKLAPAADLEVEQDTKIALKLPPVKS